MPEFEYSTVPLRFRLPPKKRRASAFAARQNRKVSNLIQDHGATPLRFGDIVNFSAASRLSTKNLSADSEPSLTCAVFNASNICGPSLESQSDNADPFRYVHCGVISIGEAMPHYSNQYADVIITGSYKMGSSIALSNIDPESLKTSSINLTHLKNWTADYSIHSLKINSNFIFPETPTFESFIDPDDVDTNSLQATSFDNPPETQSLDSGDSEVSISVLQMEDDSSGTTSRWNPTAYYVLNLLKKSMDE